MACIAHFDTNRQPRERFTSPRSAAEQSARVTQKFAALGEMTGGVAHDVRNILAVVESGLRIAERTNEPERLRVGIAAAREGLDRGAKLISQLLNFAKQQELGIQAGDANELLRNLGVFLQYGAGPGIRIVFKLAADLPECVVDRAQFGTALLNLVVNARDAMPRGGEIEISTERRTIEAASSGSLAPGTYVCVRVKDEGQGMSADVMQRVFDPFFTTKGERGTGLGLPQVCAFMQRIGGSVNISSERGKGTAVDLLFPPVDSMGEARRIVMAKKNRQERSMQKLDLELDRELEATFPASDPLKITRKRPPKPKVSRRRRILRHVMAPDIARQ